MHENIIKILHLYHDLMNLYGEWANAAILERELTDRARASVVERKSVGDEVDFSIYDFIFIGCGTERSLYACIRDIARHKEALLKCVEANIPVLATGNAHELFGHAVTDAGGMRHEALGLLDFETVHLNTRITGDCMCNASFLPEKLIGFINRAGGYQTGTAERPFVTELGPGASGGDRTEGIIYKNLLGTYMTGPVLVRNPPLLRFYADMLEHKGSILFCTKGSNIEPTPCNRCTPDPLFTYLPDAYDSAVKELSKRARK